MSSERAQPELVRTTLAVLVLSFLIIATFSVLKPFLAALIWAATIVISSWTAFTKVEKLFGGRRALAVIAMVGVWLIILMLPLTVAFTTIVEHVDFAKEKSQVLMEQGLPDAPAWLGQIPLVGTKLQQRWNEFSHLSRDEVLTRAKPFVGTAITWLGGQIGSFGRTMLHFIVTLIIAALLYAKGDSAARGVRKFAKRLAKERGESAVILANNAIRAVAAGVVITALIQAILSGIGLLICGVPYAVALTSLVFLLCVIQLGAWPVLFGAVAWLYYQDHQAAAWGLGIYSLLVLISDNFIRPVLIKRGADLPLVLIFAGVIGGLISFGIIGLFVGPVILAVSYTLLSAWIDEVPVNGKKVKASS